MRYQFITSHDKCYICGSKIGSGSYSESYTKSCMINGKQLGKKRIIFHTECYRKMTPKYKSEVNTDNEN